MQELRLPDGRARLVRHGHGPERDIQTGIGSVAVARPRIRNRGAPGPADRVRFSPPHPAEMGAAHAQPRCLLPVL